MFPSNILTFVLHCYGFILLQQHLDSAYSWIDFYIPAYYMHIRIISNNKVFMVIYTSPDVPMKKMYRYIYFSYVSFMHTFSIHVVLYNINV